MSLRDGKFRSVGVASATAIVLVDFTVLHNEIITFPGPAKVYRLGIHAATAKTTGTAAVFTVQSVAGVTETVLGTATTPDTFAIAQELTKEFNPPLVVPLGSYGKVEMTTAAGGGSPTGKVWLEYTNEPLTKTYLDGLTQLT